MQVTDEALEHIARAMRERDVTIAYLQEQLASLEGAGSDAEPNSAHAREDPTTPETLADAQVPETLADAQVPETLASPEVPEAPEATQALERPEPSQVHQTAQAPELIQAPGAPRTTLVLKASAAKAPRVPEPHEATQPSDTLQAHEATQPAGVLDGPQGSYDTHDWWAEQGAAAREEAAEEQGW
jgi:hypothetical protein